MENLKFELKPYMNCETECEKVELELVDEIDQLITDKESEISALTVRIDELTNQADALDYTIAVASGVLTGLMDIFLGDELKKYVDESVNKSVINNAKQQSAKHQFQKAQAEANEKNKTLPNDTYQRIKASVDQKFTPLHNENGVISPEEEQRVLQKAIRYFERHCESPTDAIWNKKGSEITSKSHHLDDFSHHASVIGLTASILTQFTRHPHGFFSNKNGEFLPIAIDSNSFDLIGNTIPTKIACGFGNWFWHLMSDVSGTSKTAGGGMGVPGPILSVAKLISSVPGMSKTNFSQIVNDIFVDARFDLRSEIAQSVPVLINEIIVRFLFCMRRLMIEFNSKNNWTSIDWKSIIPFGNRTVEGMMTIASGTFCALDIADAAIRSGGFNSNTLLKLNFVGIGRFTVALGTDFAMGLSKGKCNREQMLLKNQMLCLYEAKMYQGEVLLWEATQEADASIDGLEKAMCACTYDVNQSLCHINKKVESIKTISASSINENNPTLAREILGIL